MPAVENAKGAWCWFSDARAIYSATHNRTYVSWVDPTGNLKAAQFDYATGEVSTVTLHANFNQDDHANPSFLEIEGKVHVFYAHHQATDVYYRSTDASGNLSTLGSVKGLGIPNYSWAKPPISYAVPVYVPADTRTMVFFRSRKANGDPHWGVLVNQNKLATNSWGGYAIWACATGRSPYLKAYCNNTNTVELLMTDGHPYYDADVSIYHARFKHEGGVAKWENSAGTQITSVPFGPAQATEVADGASLGNTWNWQVSRDAGGNPVGLISTYPNNDPNDARHAFVGYDSQNGWSTSEICVAGLQMGSNGFYYTAGCCFDGADKAVVYSGVLDSNGGRIEKHRTLDGGVTWSLEEVISPTGPDPQFRPFSPEGYAPDTVSLFWWDGPYPDYFHYNGQLHQIGYVSKKQLAIDALDVMAADVTNTQSSRDAAAALSGWLENA